MNLALEALLSEQRAVAEPIMKQRTPALQKAPSPQQLRKTGTFGTANDVDCNMYELLEQGAKLSESWVANWGRVSSRRELADVIVDWCRPTASEL